MIIDYLRDRQEAVDFIRDAGPRPSVSAVTAAELFAGAGSATEQRRTDDPLGQLVVHSVDLEVARLDGAYRRRYGQSHGVPILDA